MASKGSKKVSLSFNQATRCLPPWNTPVICRWYNKEQNQYFYEIGEVIELQKGPVWLDTSYEEMLQKPEEWSLLPNES